ncbi:thymidine kinase [Blautia sp. MSJ-9]|uniref:thymidine kinase n=1 Tax=Blautia sp. MSJ-9 TaxID=2841511 RepID=UPI001C0F4AFF|nr:thymidine kinase [Blautia sp. MSJ-9]MBU5681484.1 thymidine kinase [Blautia sp. MSJ-9]
MAKLYFRYGAMGSSKSANILMVRYNYEERGQYAVLLKPRTDNRDGEHEIQSRIGLSAPAEYVDEFLKEIAEFWDDEISEYTYHGKRVDAILVDEAQFLSPEEVDTLSDIVDFYNIPVLCYGLRTDFLNHLFSGSRRLMEIADVIEEVPTVCWCGKRAQCNTRYANGKIVREGAQIMLGSNESYVALCRKHYKEGRLWKEDPKGDA